LLHPIIFISTVFHSSLAYPSLSDSSPRFILLML
jgi:hypothetical protein